MASASLLSSTILFLLIASAYSTYLGNVLNAGDMLKSGDNLSIGNYNFTMQSDCNLVLYGNDVAIWASNTKGLGTNCYMILMGNGELFIFSGSYNSIWSTQTGGAYGKYSLVLQPNGNVVVYGNPVWSTGTVNVSPTNNSNNP